MKIYKHNPDTWKINISDYNQEGDYIWGNTEGDFFASLPENIKIKNGINIVPIQDADDANFDAVALTTWEEKVNKLFWSKAQQVIDGILRDKATKINAHTDFEWFLDFTKEGLQKTVYHTLQDAIRNHWAEVSTSSSFNTNGLSINNDLTNWIVSAQQRNTAAWNSLQNSKIDKYKIVGDGFIGKLEQEGPNGSIEVHKWNNVELGKEINSNDLKGTSYTTWSDFLLNASGLASTGVITSIDKYDYIYLEDPTDRDEKQLWRFEGGDWTLQTNWDRKDVKEIDGDRYLVYENYVLAGSEGKRGPVGDALSVGTITPELILNSVKTELLSLDTFASKSYVDVQIKSVTGAGTSTKADITKEVADRKAADAVLDAKFATTKAEALTAAKAEDAKLNTKIVKNTADITAVKTTQTTDEARITALETKASGGFRGNYDKATIGSLDAPKAGDFAYYKIAATGDTTVLGTTVAYDAAKPWIKLEPTGTPLAWKAVSPVVYLATHPFNNLTAAEVAAIIKVSEDKLDSRITFNEDDISLINEDITSVRGEIVANKKEVDALSATEVKAADGSITTPDGPIVANGKAITEAMDRIQFNETDIADINVDLVDVKGDIVDLQNKDKAQDALLTATKVVQSNGTDTKNVIEMTGTDDDTKLVSKQYVDEIDQALNDSKQNNLTANQLAVLAGNAYTTAEKTKLAGLEAGATFLGDFPVLAADTDAQIKTKLNTAFTTAKAGEYAEIIQPSATTSDVKYFLMTKAASGWTKGVERTEHIITGPSTSTGGTAISREEVKTGTVDGAKDKILQFIEENDGRVFLDKNGKATTAKDTMTAQVATTVPFSDTGTGFPFERYATSLPANRYMKVGDTLTLTTSSGTVSLTIAENGKLFDGAFPIQKNYVILTLVGATKTIGSDKYIEVSEFTLSKADPISATPTSINYTPYTLVHTAGTAGDVERIELITCGDKGGTHFFYGINDGGIIQNYKDQALGDGIAEFKLILEHVPKATPPATGGTTTRRRK